MSGQLKPMSIKRALAKWPGLPIASCVHCGQHCAVIDGRLGKHCSVKFFYCPRVGLQVDAGQEHT